MCYLCVVQIINNVGIMKVKSFIIVLAGFLAFNFGCSNQPKAVENQDDAEIQLTAEGFANDYADILSAEQRDALELRLEALDDSTGNQIAVAIVNEFEGDNILDFATRLGKQWGVGQKDKNNGVMIVVKVKTDDSNGQVAIAIGTGIEDIIPNATCQNIIDREMVPHFKENDYYSGINAAIDAIIPIVTGQLSYSDYDAQNIENK